MVAPKELTVGQVLNFIQGPVGPVECVSDDVRTAKSCPLYGGCAFLGLWERAQKAISDVYDQTTFQDLIDENNAKQNQYVPSYNI